MDGRMDRWMDARVDAWMIVAGWIDGSWVDGCMDGWMDGRVDGLFAGSVVREPQVQTLSAVSRKWEKRGGPGGLLDAPQIRSAAFGRIWDEVRRLREASGMHKYCSGRFQEALELQK